MRKVFAITYVLMAIFLSNGVVLAENSPKTGVAPSKTDTIKRVTVRVVARERPTNYDSIFRSQSSHFDNPAKNSSRPSALKPRRIVKSKPSAESSKDVFSASAKPQKAAPKNTQNTVRNVTRPEKSLPVARTQPPAKPVNAPKPSAPKPKSEKMLAVNTAAHTASNKIREPEPSLSTDDLFSDANEAGPAIAEQTEKVSPPPSTPEPQQASVVNDALPKTDNIAAANSKVSDFSIENSPKANKISYMWIGFVLVLAGVVLGLVFGRTAFMVSVVGVVFLIIGFYI